MDAPPIDAPDDPAALAARIRGLAASGDTVRIVGTQSLHDNLPRPPARAHLLSTRGLQGLEIDVPNLIVHVQAGVAPEDLRTTLTAQGVIWPVERLELHGTVGGLVASGRGSAISPADGPARRWLLGAHFVDGLGDSISVGGMTVKNSSGYGLTHALWGSLGRLGAIVRVTLRLRYKTPDDVAADSETGVGLWDEPVRVRCEDLPPGVDRHHLADLAADAPAAIARDGSRAVLGFARESDAAAAIQRLRSEGIGAMLDTGAAPAAAAGAPWVALRQALDPRGVFV